MLQQRKISATYKGIKQNREVRAFYWGFFTKKEDLLVLKMDTEQLPHEIYTTVGSKKLRQKQMRRTEMNEELYKWTC